jgi:hypothetical protein
MNIERLAERIRLIANEVAALAPEHDVSSQLGRLETLQAELAKEIESFKTSTALPMRHLTALTEMLERSKVSDPPASRELPSAPPRADGEKLEGYNIPKEAMETAKKWASYYVKDDGDSEYCVRAVLSIVLPYFVPKERTLRDDAAAPIAHPETDADFRLRIYAAGDPEATRDGAAHLCGSDLDWIGLKYGLKRRGLSSDTEESASTPVPVSEMHLHFHPPVGSVLNAVGNIVQIEPQEPGRTRPMLDPGTLPKTGEFADVRVEVIRCSDGNIFFKSDDGTEAYRRYGDIVRP